MSKIEGEGGGPIDPPPSPKASCNYFIFEASGVNFFSGKHLRFFKVRKKITSNIPHIHSVLQFHI